MTLVTMTTMKTMITILFRLTILTIVNISSNLLMCNIQVLVRYPPTSLLKESNAAICALPKNMVWNS